MKIKHLFVSILLVTGFQPMIAQSALRQQFVNSPVQEARPWTFWYWMFGAVTPEGITADLEAMHRIGLGGAYLMPIKGVEQGPQYEGKAQQLTPEWWRMVTHSMREADRLGMQLGMHICDGFALAGSSSLDFLVLDVWRCNSRRDYCRFGGHASYRFGWGLSDAY